MTCVCKVQEWAEVRNAGMNEFRSEQPLAPNDQIPVAVFQDAAMITSGLVLTALQGVLLWHTWSPQDVWHQSHRVRHPRSVPRENVVWFDILCDVLRNAKGTMRS